MLNPRSWIAVWRSLASLTLALLLVGCSPGSPAGVATLVPLGPIAGRLMTFDPVGMIQGLPNGGPCTGRRIAGGPSNVDSARTTWFISCPRTGNDRTAYFQLADEIKPALERAGAQVPASSSGVGDAGEPLAQDWMVHGEGFVGTARTMGVDTESSLGIFVTLDLIAR